MAVKFKKKIRLLFLVHGEVFYLMLAINIYILYISSSNLSTF